MAIEALVILLGEDDPGHATLVRLGLFLQIVKVPREDDLRGGKQ